MLQEPIASYSPESKPFGLTYGQWTVKWWQWLTSIPTGTNPAVDEDGHNAAVNQNDPYVWFLAGTFVRRNAMRNCVVPASKAILFPVINYQMNSIESPELKDEFELTEHVRQDEDDIVSLKAVIDGQKLPIYRVRSDPLMFQINVPEDNPFAIAGGGSIKTTADGYWVFLKPLTPGEHYLDFAGACAAGARSVAAVYNLTSSD